MSVTKRKESYLYKLNKINEELGHLQSVCLKQLNIGSLNLASGEYINFLSEFNIGYFSAGLLLYVKAQP
jgi:hypothetical protein